MISPHLSLARSSTRTKILAAVGLIAALIYLVAGQLPDAQWLRLIAKPIPVLVLAYWVSTLPVRGRYQLAITMGLLLCALGDILLEMSEATFLVGLVAFLLGHVAYVVAFTQDTRKLCPFWAAGAYIYGVIAYQFLFFSGNLGSMAIPVLLYVAIICTMLWRAGCRLAAPGVSRFSAWAGVIGALFFVASDTILALRLFETPIQLAGPVVMVTYWIGQTGIALSALREPGKSLKHSTP